jgi:hypothetical protein
MEINVVLFLSPRMTFWLADHVDRLHAKSDGIFSLLALEHMSKGSIFLGL